MMIITASELVACEGCGCRGGPGFRGPDGKCVGWKNLAKVCGNPPTTHCEAEGPALESLNSDPTKSHNALQSGAANKARRGSYFNERTTTADAIACQDQADLTSVGDCVEDPAEKQCETQVIDTLTSGRCMRIPAGTPAVIQAGDGSLDAVRVRLPGQSRELWIARRHVLE